VDWNIILNIWLALQVLSLVMLLAVFQLALFFLVITSLYWGPLLGLWLMDKFERKSSKKEVHNVS